MENTDKQFGLSNITFYFFAKITLGVFSVHYITRILYYSNAIGIEKKCLVLSNFLQQCQLFGHKDQDLGAEFYTLTFHTLVLLSRVDNWEQGVSLNW